jgi:hypothetical protein
MVITKEEAIQKILGINCVESNFLKHMRALELACLKAFRYNMQGEEVDIIRKEYDKFMNNPQPWPGTPL